MSEQLQVGFCVSGNGHLFRSAVSSHQQLNINPVVAILDHTAHIQLDDFCHRNQVRVVRLGKMPRAQLNEQLTEVILSQQLDLMSLTFDRIIPPTVVDSFAGRLINVHMGLLPAFKGMRAIDQAIAYGVRYAGATIHQVTNELDGGPIIAQCVAGVRQNESADKFGMRLFNYLRLMYLQVLSWFATDRIYTDVGGRLWVRDAVYGMFPISPAVERSFVEPGFEDKR